jgi:arylsulfatase A-like enzyme
MPASLDIEPYYYIENKRPVALPTDTIASMEGTAPAEGQRKIQGPFYRGGKVAPGFDHEKVLDKFGGKAVDYIRTAAQQKENPFFLYLALPAPHTPWLPTEQFSGKSGAGSYGDYVLQVDNLVGNVLKALADQGLEENTLVVFTSDNGPVWYPENVAQYQHNSVVPLAGMKGDAWEGGHRLPFIARWPGNIEAGTQNAQLICFTDILATFADLTKVSLSAEYPNNSQSILPLLLDPDHAATRSVFVMKSSGGAFAVRKGDWKLILAKGSGGFMDGYDKSLAEKNPFEGQLYNLADDISETTNLYAQHPEKVAELKEELEAF